MNTQNDGLRRVHKKTGTQNGPISKDGEMARDGYETLDKADGGRARAGLTKGVKHSMEGMGFYRPRGR